MGRKRMIPQRIGPVRRLFLCAPVLTGLATEAFAQDRGGPSVSLTPYLWLASVTGTLGTAVPALPTQRVEADFGDVLSHINAIPVMLAAEIRQGRFGVLADLMAISVEADTKPAGTAFSGGEARLRQVIGSVLLAWRVVEGEPVALDLGLGLRAFGVATRFTLEPGALPDQRIERDANWVNPIVGLRYRHAIGAGWAATVYGDLGGAEGDLTWQALATLDYRWSDSVTLSLGYRWLNVERDSGALRQEIGLGGPLLGATMRF
jgi:hypothetical protein